MTGRQRVRDSWAVWAPRTCQWRKVSDSERTGHGEAGPGQPSAQGHALGSAVQAAKGHWGPRPVEPVATSLLSPYQPQNSPMSRQTAAPGEGGSCLCLSLVLSDVCQRWHLFNKPGKRCVPCSGCTVSSGALPARLHILVTFPQASLSRAVFQGE